MITKLYATNLKGKTFSHDTGKVTAFVGKNFAGKTARLDALRLAIWGYIPAIGKLISSTVGLFSDTTGSVGVEIDGQNIKRTYHRRASGSKQELSGTPPEIPDVLLSSSDFFGLSVDKRLQYIFSRIPIDGARFNRGMVVSGLKNIKLENHKEAHENAVNALVVELPPASEEMDSWLQSSIDLVDSRTKQARQSADRLHKSHEAAVQTAGPAVNLVDAESAYKARQSAVAEWEKRLESAKSGLEEIASTKSEIRRLKSELVACEFNELSASLERKELGSLKSSLGSGVYTSKTGELAAELEEINAAITAESAANDEVNLIKDQIENLNEVLTEWPAASERLNLALLELEEAKVGMNSAMATYDKALLELDGMSESATCKECGSDLRKIKATEVKGLLAMLEMWRKGVEACQSTVWLCNTAVESFERYSSNLSERKLKLKQLSSRHDRADELLKAREAVSGSIKLSIAADNLHVEQTGKLSTLQANIVNYDNLVERRAEFQKQLDAIKVGDEMEFEASVKECGDRLPTMQAELVELERNWKRAIGQKQQESSIRACLRGAEAADAEYDVCKAATVVLREVRNEMVSVSVAPIIDRANLVSGAVLKTLLQFRDGDIGRMEGNNWVSYKTFSGTEEAVTFAAFAFALAVDSPLKLVYLDEMGRLDDANKCRLVDVMIRLTKDGVIDQFFCVDTSDAAYLNSEGHPRPGITLIKV